MELCGREDQSCLVMEELTKIDALAPSRAEWRDAAISFYRNWINMIVVSTRRKATNAALLATRPRRLTVEA